MGTLPTGDFAFLCEVTVETAPAVVVESPVDLETLVAVVDSLKKFVNDGFAIAPSWPSLFEPVAQTLPPLLITMLWKPPAAIDLAPVDITCINDILLVFDPSPS